MKSEFSPEDLRKALLDWSAAARDALATGDFDKARLAIAGLATFAHEVATEPAPAWQPISTAPQDGTEFLGYKRGNLATAYRVPRDDCEMWVFGNESGAYEHWPEVRPTHWMPKPPAPGA
jgi:hypothetical protein